MSKRTAILEAVLSSRKPIRGIFPGSCASTVWQSAKSMAQNANTVIFLCMFFPLSRLDTPHSPFFSLDHLIRPRQHIGRNRQADLICRFQIYHKVELGRLLDRQISGLCPLQNLLDKGGRSAGQLGSVCPIRHEPTSVRKRAVWIHRGQPALSRKIYDPCPVSTDERIR